MDPPTARCRRRQGRRQDPEAQRGRFRLQSVEETQAADQHGDLATALTLGEKIRVIDGLGPGELAQRVGIEAADLLPKLERVRELRNAIGHYDEESLADPTWVHMRMVETRDLARRLTT
jgi:monoamine oxidase